MRGKFSLLLAYVALDDPSKSTSLFSINKQGLQLFVMILLLLEEVKSIFLQK